MSCKGYSCHINIKSDDLKVLRFCNVQLNIRMNLALGYGIS